VFGGNILSISIVAATFKAVMACGIRHGVSALLANGNKRVSYHKDNIVALIAIRRKTPPTKFVCCTPAISELFSIFLIDRSNNSLRQTFSATVKIDYFFTHNNLSAQYVHDSLSSISAEQTKTALHVEGRFN
jgi:hypothetical protein